MYINSPVAESSAQIRRTYLSHEASVKSIGILYYLTSFTLFIVVLSAAFGKGDLVARMPVAAIGACLSYVYFQVGRWLRQLNPKAKTPATLLAVIGLIAFPIGTLINGYILYLLHSQKGKTVLSEAYQQIIAETPDIKYKTSIVVWIFLALLILFFGFILVSVALRH